VYNLVGGCPVVGLASLATTPVMSSDPTAPGGTLQTSNMLGGVLKSLSPELQRAAGLLYHLIMQCQNGGAAPSLREVRQRFLSGKYSR